MSFLTLEKLQRYLTELKKAAVRDTLDIPHFKLYIGDPPGASQPDFDDSNWADFPVGEVWGGRDVTAWFRTRLTIPPAWRDQRVYLHCLVGPRDGGKSTAETLVYVDGQPLQAFDGFHDDAWLPWEVTRRGEVTLALKAWSGIHGAPDHRRFTRAQLQLIDPAVESLFYLASALIKSAQQLDPNDLRRVRLVTLLDQAFQQVDWLRLRAESFYTSVQTALLWLRAALEPLYAVDEIKPHIWGVGHAHIDMAWLWRLSQTREKAARTFSTALHLMREYPEYRFMHSSPQLYAYLKRDYPDLYEQVKQRVAAGQWEITGGMWIEADTNLPSGESLIRQFLHGQRFIRNEFGRESTVLWLPDVFGYSWALPQIARGCGMTSFMTTKISWNQFNHLPYDTFRWRGVDGAELLTHFVTTPDRDMGIYTYNCGFTPDDIRGAWDNYHQKDLNDELLLLFGWGDGGGGPTREMLETARALRNLPGMPRISHTTSEDYFARLTERLAGQTLPVWDGELYLEYHRGTYTSQAASKRANRQSEILYHTAEWLSALADVLTGASDYPASQLDEGWQLILLNQFHDVLPGSSIAAVYEDCRVDYARVFAIGRQAVDQARSTLAAHVGAAQPSLLVLNPLSWTRDDVVELPWTPDWDGQTILLDDSRPALTQMVERDGQRRLLVEVTAAPALGYRAFPRVALADLPVQPDTLSGSAPPGSNGHHALEVGLMTLAEPVAPLDATPMTVSPTRLENDFYRLILDERGHLVSLWDKRAAREVLAPGRRGNVLQVFVDRPIKHDAWDIDPYYQDQMEEIADLQEAVVEEAGPVRGTLRLIWRFSNSVITQRLSLWRRSPRIDFHTLVDWREPQVLLKVAFPVDIRATRATYDIQFGQIERPTHWNTSWDWARFEVPAHKWADLSQGDYGVALLNDCKYGYDIHDHVMRLTLIKTPINPDPQADLGHHEFTYSLLPHGGDWRDGDVVRAGYGLNVPLLAATVPAQPNAPLPAASSFVTVDALNVVVETVKQAEDGDGWTVRVYETGQSAARGHLRFGRPLSRVEACNLVERDAEPVAFDGNAFDFELRPYQIKTYKVWFADK